MTTVTVSPLQLKLKEFSIWIENKFDSRIPRLGFALRIVLAALVFHLCDRLYAEWRGLWPVTGPLAAWAVFWGILLIVRRLHDLGRAGGLIWGILVPFGVAWRIIEVFHLTEKSSERWWVWILLAGLCAWSVWIMSQLFFKAGAESPSRLS